MTTLLTEFTQIEASVPKAFSTAGISYQEGSVLLCSPLAFLCKFSVYCLHLYALTVRKCT